MSAQPIPPMPFRAVNVNVGETVSTPSFWDRVTTWASENKAVVYTIAGIAVVVTGAGAVYYFSDSSTPQASAERKASKKERRKAKKEKEAIKPVLEGWYSICKTLLKSNNHIEVTPSSPKAKVETTTEQELPQIDETTVDFLSDQVSDSLLLTCF
jgi:mitochondrial import receptor subunit TOM70